MANDVQGDMTKYQLILDSIFGKSECAVRLKQPYTNNFVGALVFRGDSPFYKFSAAFKQRLRRLHTIYEKPSADRSALLRLAQDLASPTPEGPYGELAALDFLNRTYLHYARSPVQTEINLPVSETFVSITKPRNVCNLDGYIAAWDLHFEVKSLTDITNGIIEDILRVLRLKHQALILPERESALDYKLLQHNKRALRQELDNALSQKQTFLKSQIVPELSFRIGWPPAVLVTSTAIDPFQMAAQRHQTFFDYSYKFLHSKPFMLVVTVPRWSNPHHSKFVDMNKTFFRSLSRRIFCQYLNSTALHPDYATPFSELSRAIGGILFLEINDDLGDDPAPHIEPYMYLNPNATHPLHGQLRHFITYAQKGLFEDFRHDNY